MCRAPPAVIASSAPHDGVEVAVKLKRWLQAALNMLLSKSALKEMLKDVLVEVKTSEEDKKKLKVRPQLPFT